jgi:light-regulated signal transduction histidine kinase (bacteriophytochrome)
VKIEIDSAMPVLISERIFLTQIFSNLISNAIKYHDKPDGFVKIFHREEETNYVFFVQDNGPGIAKNYHNKIFVIFQTLNENNSFENTGVGLAIVKKIIEDKNQTISVLSEQGKGSTFSFTWPKF